MALIHELQISPEERVSSRESARRMAAAVMQRKVSNIEIARIFEEWQVLARRIRHGEELIEKCYRELASGGKSPDKEQHLQRLGDLFLLITSMFSLYGQFFSWVYKDDPGKLGRANNKVAEILRDAG